MDYRRSYVVGPAIGVVSGIALIVYSAMADTPDQKQEPLRTPALYPTPVPERMQGIERILREDMTLVSSLR